VNRSEPEITSRRALWWSAGLGLALLLALGAFFTLQHRVAPLWVVHRPAQATTP
jgi:hypothetical protein